MKKFIEPWIILLIFIAATALSQPNDANKKEYKVVCYWSSWSAYRNGEGKFGIENIDPFLCSHCIYAFAGLSRDNTIEAYDPYLDLEDNRGMGMYKKFTDLKKRHKHLKMLLSIGGWKESSTKYSSMAKNANSRARFVQSCVTFLQRYGFDGLDLAWLYPAHSGGAPEDKTNFLLLLQELKQSFDSKSLILSIAVPAGRSIVDAGYNVAEISKYVTFFNVMTYDYHGDWEPKTGHSTPLYARLGESASDKLLNIDSSIKYWLSKGAPKEKMIMGMALYGRTHTLKFPQATSLGAATVGKGPQGHITQQPGSMGFNEICLHLSKESNWKVEFDRYHQAPYTFKGDQWIAYDDVQSISLKMDYLKDMGLGGAMVWSIDTDDFRGNCYGFPYPLLSVIQEDLNGPLGHRPEEPETSTTAEPTTLSPTPDPLLTTTTRKIGTKLECLREGYFKHPDDCKKFYYCQPYQAGFITVIYDCGTGTWFDERIAACGFRCYPP